MEKVKVEICNDVAAQLFPAEMAVDEALVHLSKLTIAMVQGRARAQLPIGIGQSAMLHLGEATASAFKLRTQVARAHGGLSAIYREIGAPEMFFGPSTTCPDKDEPHGSVAAPAEQAVSLT